MPKRRSSSNSFLKPLYPVRRFNSTKRSFYSPANAKLKRPSYSVSRRSVSQPVIRSVYPRPRQSFNYSSSYSYGKRPSYSQVTRSSYSTPSYSSTRRIAYQRTYPSFRDYYNSYAFYKPKVIGTAKDIYREGKVVGGAVRSGAVKAGGFVVKEAKAVGSFTRSLLQSKKSQKAVSSSKPKAISQPKPVVIPMVKKTTQDGIEVYESEK